MLKEYENPEIAILLLGQQGIITGSLDDGDDNLIEGDGTEPGDDGEYGGIY